MKLVLEKDGGVCSGLPTETRSCNTQNCPCKFPMDENEEKIGIGATFFYPARNGSLLAHCTGILISR